MSVGGYTIPKIIFIKGVFIKDCIPIDDIFEQQLIEQLQSDAPIKKYEPLPSTFYSVDSWVPKTNNKCWYCDLSFDNQPVFIPKNIDKLSRVKKHNISTLGCFCSFCCAMSFNNIYNPQICDNTNTKEMILYLFHIFHPDQIIKNIPESPNKYIMKHYGGEVSTMAYRHMINDLKKKLTTKGQKHTRRLEYHDQPDNPFAMS